MLIKPVPLPAPQAILKKGELPEALFAPGISVWKSWHRGLWPPYLFSLSWIALRPASLAELRAKIRFCSMLASGPGNAGGAPPTVSQTPLLRCRKPFALTSDNLAHPPHEGLYT